MVVAQLRQLLSQVLYHLHYLRLLIEMLLLVLFFQEVPQRHTQQRDVVTKGSFLHLSPIDLKTVLERGDVLDML